MIIDDFFIATKAEKQARIKTKGKKPKKKGKGNGASIKH